MRILHIDTGEGWRGGQQQLYWLSRGLRDRGAEQVIMASNGSPLEERTRREQFRVISLTRPANSWGNIRQVRQIVRNFDIIHAHDAHAHSLAAMATLGSQNSPRLVVSRRVAFPIGLLSRPKFEIADAYLAVSDFVAHQLLEAQVPVGKVHVIYDGVHVPKLPQPAEDRAAMRKQYKTGNNVFLLGSLTSIAPEKLLHEQIDLLSELPAAVQLWIGRPAAENCITKEETELLDYARSRGHEKRFRIISVAEDASTFLSCLDLFLYFSRMEGLGSAILLAMACGLAVVASDVGGIPEIVRNHKTGLLVRNGPKDELSQAVRTLIDSPPLRERYGAAGRRFILENATADIMVSKTKAIYEQLLQGRDTHPS